MRAGTMVLAAWTGVSGNSPLVSQVRELEANSQDFLNVRGI